MRDQKFHFKAIKINLFRYYLIRYYLIGKIILSDLLLVLKGEAYRSLC